MSTFGPILTKESYRVVAEVVEKVIDGSKLEVLVGLPYSGRSLILRQMMYNPEFYSEEFKKKVEKIVGVVFDIPSEAGLDEVWQNSPWGKKMGGNFEEAVEKIVSSGKRLVLAINSIDTLGDSKETRKNWKKLMAIYYRHQAGISWIIGQGWEEVDDVAGWLREMDGYYLTNKNWLPMRTLEDISLFLKNSNSQKPETGKIYGLSGGYYCLAERLREKPELVDAPVAVNDGVIDHYLGILWESCGEKSQQQLLDLMRGKSSNFNDYLAKTGVVKIEEGKWKLFSPLFYEWLKKMVGSKRPEIEEKLEKLWLGSSDLSEELSYQEYEVLKLLWQKQGEVVVRNEVAEVLWPNDTEDKYSDWAIDQVMAKIRKKLGDVGENRLIRTIKGKGMMLEK
ncbi:MAG: helix-turn-helix domain-containing protein [Candidatus Shapirobacteria bacterium]